MNLIYDVIERMNGGTAGTLAALSIGGIILAVLGVWELSGKFGKVLQKVPSKVWSYTLPALPVVFGACSIGFGIGQCIEAPPSGMNTIGLSDDKLRSILGDRDASPEKLDKVLAYAKERDNRQVTEVQSRPTTFNGSYTLGFGGILMGVALVVCGILFWIKELG